MLLTESRFIIPTVDILGHLRLSLSGSALHSQTWVNFYPVNNNTKFSKTLAKKETDSY